MLKSLLHYSPDFLLHFFIKLDFNIGIPFDFLMLVLEELSERRINRGEGVNMEKKLEEFQKMMREEFGVEE